MATCPRGHDSGSDDYCDVCGALIGGAVPNAAKPSGAAAAPAPAPTPDETCPRCATPRTGRFCEADGYDFLTASLTGTGPGGGRPVTAHGSLADPAAATPTPAGTWLVTVSADRAYFEAVRQMGGEDAEALTFPRFVPERRFPLNGERFTIGRHSRSRGIYPDIDLVGPPEDPGVSHLHALLAAQPDGTWTLVDLGSANGTYLNDPAADPIDPHVPVPVAPGDTIYLGAFTTLSLNAAT